VPSNAKKTTGGQSNRGYFSDKVYIPSRQQKMPNCLVTNGTSCSGQHIRLSGAVVASISFFPLSVDATSHFSLFTAPSGQPRLDSFINLLASFSIGDSAIYIEFANNVQSTRSLINFSSLLSGTRQKPTTKMKHCHYSFLPTQLLLLIANCE